jgi:hypothetical protein
LDTIHTDKEAVKYGAKNIPHDGRKGGSNPGSHRLAKIIILNDGTVNPFDVISSIRANQELIDFLAEILEVAPARIEVVAGTTGHDKLVSILDMDAATVQQRIIKNL